MRKIFGFIVSAAMLLPSLTSASPLEPISDERLGQILEELRHSPLQIQIQEKVVDKDNGCIYAEVNLPVVDPNTAKYREQKLYIVRPEKKAKSPVVVIVPTIEGRTILENRVSGSLCEKGIAAIIADVNDNTQPEEIPAWGHEDRNHRWALHALQTTIDFAQSHPNFEPEHVAAMGLSLGGITTSMLIGIETRLRGAMIAAAGGNFPEMLALTKNKHLVRLRERRMEYLKIKEIGDYEKELRSRLVFDPLYFHKRVTKESVMMMLVKDDRMVPEITQRELWESYGKPNALWFDQGHVGSLVRLSYLWMDEISAFFLERFKD